VAPTFPSLYNNFKRIVQTDDYVMIELEMVHDARIVRMNQEHLPPHLRKWMGDSVGRWEGDTLVVESTNFSAKTNVRGSGDGLRLTERFTRTGGNSLLYEFTVSDPASFTRPWSAALPMAKTDDQIYEYACHEGNYAMTGILRGARAGEK